jgi:hypothetical protein
VPGGVFSLKHPRMLRWASADLVPFSTFFTFLDRFLPVFVPYFALFPSMPCAYLYVNNFFSARLARNVLTSNRKGRQARKGRIGEGQTTHREAIRRKNAEGGWGEQRNGTAFTAAGHPGTATSRAVAGGRGRIPARGDAENAENGGETIFDLGFSIFDLRPPRRASVLR